MSLTSEQLQFLYNSAYATISELADEQGIAASSRQEAYGCLFGRDSAISVLKLLEVYRKKPDVELLEICRRTLLTHTVLQGKNYVIESGEEPGKFVHEFRQNNYERLINRPKPWYVYPDKMLRNYDSVDATPLLLLAYHKFWKITQDDDFLLRVLPSVEAGLQWLITDADKDRDYLIEYELPQERTFGGLVVQSWTDSHACLTTADGKFPLYPIAAVEVQAIAWSALKTWGHFFETKDKKLELAHQLNDFAGNLKTRFNQLFIIKDKTGKSVYAHQALDGHKQPISTITSNPLLCLWAIFEPEQLHKDAIIDSITMHHWVERAFEKDMFDEFAGIRTMSTLSPTFDPSNHSYHNGSFWPFVNGLIYEGLMKWGFHAHASKLRTASLLPLSHFQSPIELYCSVEAGVYNEYISTTGKKGCRQQAWTAAAILDWLT